MSYKLFLDDERFSPEECSWIELPQGCWVVIKDFESFRESVALAMPDIVSFDHDLDGTAYREYLRACERGYIDYSCILKPTGLDCAKWIVTYCSEKGLKQPTIFIHTHNPFGKKNLETFFNLVGWNYFTYDYEASAV